MSDPVVSHGAEPGEGRPVAASSDLSWAHLDRLKVGRYVEYFVKMALVRAGLDVYAPEVDDKAIDFVVRVPGSPARYVEVQVKAARSPTGYIFVRKRHFALDPNRMLALVMLIEGRAPELFLIPAAAWTAPRPPFVSHDYEGLKSEPEYGINLSAAAMTRLQPYRFAGAASLGPFVLTADT